ncbi:MAG: dihydrolipoyl dehydrogenase family protein [Candidatus Puniceispirillaceae bacterium]
MHTDMSDKGPVISADICIIGAGSGGLSVAAGAAQMGAKTVLFEKGAMGGDCLNTGCVPSKALLAAGKLAHYGKGHDEMGISGKTSVDFAKVKAHVQDVIAGIAPHDSVERFTSLGVTVISEEASFASDKEVVSASYRVRARYFVIATGSSAFVPPIDGLSDVPFWTNETIFTATDQPTHLAIIGGGPIGMEMAQAHQRLGSKVTVLQGDRIMNRDDISLTTKLRDKLTSEGITIIEHCTVSSVSEKSGKITLKLADGQKITASHLLVATGRKPNVSGLKLDSAGIATNKRGIITDTRLRSSKKHIFAIGDVAGRHQFTHMAGYHAGIIIRNMLFKLPARISDKAVPWVTYTDPELAHVGLGEEEAIDQFGKHNITVLEWSLAENDRARAERRTEGLIKVVTTKKGHIVGASILAPAAGEMIAAWSLAISSGLKIGAMAGFIAPYPTYGEASKRVAGSFYTDKLFSARTRAIVKRLVRW